MIVGNYEFDIEELEDLQSLNGNHLVLIRDGKTLVEIYDGVDADEDGLCSDIWVKVDGKHIDWTWEFIIEFRNELNCCYGL